MLQLILGTDTGLFDPAQTQVLLLDFVKILFIIASLIYLVFAFVIVRQIQVMRSTVITPASGLMQILGFSHLVFAFAVLVLFIISL